MTYDSKTLTNLYFDYAVRFIEIYIEEHTHIHTGISHDYVQFDHKKKEEILRRPATEEEIKFFGDDGFCGYNCRQG